MVGGVALLCFMVCAKILHDGEEFVGPPFGVAFRIPIELLGGFKLPTSWRRE